MIILFDIVSLFVGLVVFFLIIGGILFSPVNLAICGISYMGIGIRFIKSGYFISGITFISFSIYVFIKLLRSNNNKEIN